MGEVYYVVYADDYAMPSKVAFDPGEPSLGRIRIDSVAPPHTLTSIKRCISRVERNRALACSANLFVDTSCDTPLEEGQISLLRTDRPGLSPNEPMAIVIVENIPDGRYLIKNRAADIYWYAYGDPMELEDVYYCPYSTEVELQYNFYLVNDSFYNYSSVQRITLFHSGTSYMIVMVTFP
jgi:hypothetical protein